MTIIGLQRRLVEVGRIRMGEKNERGLPTRLETWKLTSRDELRLRAAAKVFGGEVTEWKDHPGQYALVTEIDSLPILLMPGQAISQHYELWSGGGCKRRCDGETEQMTDGACLCDPEQRECKPHTRLNVLLPDVAGIGCWRLDTQGYYAATELTGTVDLLEIATMRGVLLPARLRIDQRAVLRDGQTKRFPVPTLDIDVRPLEMHAITQASHEGEVADLPSGYKPVAALERGQEVFGTTIEQGLAGAEQQAEPAERKSARAAAPLGQVGDFESGQTIQIPDEDEPPAAAPEEDSSVASGDQQKMLMATAREHGWKDADRYELTRRICGEEISSVKKVPKDKVDELLVALKQGPELLEQIRVADAERAADDIKFEDPDATRTRIDEEVPLDELKGQLRDYGNSLNIIQQVDAAISKHEDDRPWLERQLARLKERYEQQGAA